MQAAVGAAAVDASWTATSGSQPTRVELAWRLGSGAWTSQQFSGASTSVTGLVNDSDYTFRVRAVDTAGTPLGAWSPEVTLHYYRTTLAVVSIDTSGVPIVDRDNYVAGSMKVLPNGTGVSAYQGTLGIKGRGNSTWWFDKKPYRLKLGSSAPLMGMPSDKNWVLLANAEDHSQLRTMIATRFGQASSNLAWTPKFRTVELVLNGQYQGIYLLGEQVRISTNRINIDAMTSSDNSGDALTGGYHLELDWRLDSSGDVGFWTDPADMRYPYAIKDPDAPTPEQIAYIKQYVEQLQLAVHATTSVGPMTYRNYVDVDSFIDWYLVQEITNNQDAFQYSTHMYKPRNGTMHMGPLWDFDLSVGTIGVFSWPGARDPNQLYVRYKGWTSGIFRDPAALAQARARWNQLRPTYESIVADIPAMSASIADARANDADRWGYTVATEDTPAFLVNWLTTKFAYMNANF